MYGIWDTDSIQPGLGLFSYREGMNIDYHSCSRRFGDFGLVLLISPNFLTMFSFIDVSDVQDKLRKYICIGKYTLHVTSQKRYKKNFEKHAWGPVTRILQRFSYLKYFTSPSMFIWKNGKAQLMSKRGTNSHVQFLAKVRDYFTSKKLRESCYRLWNIYWWNHTTIHILHHKYIFLKTLSITIFNTIFKKIIAIFNNNCTIATEALERS